LYDVADPKEDFSVAHYSALVRPILDDIRERGKLPIVVGGSGLYIKALVSGIGTADRKPDRGLRKVLGMLSVGMLQKLLSVLKPAAFSGMNASDRANPRRLIRKIELASSYDTFRSDRAKSPPTDTYTIGLNADPTYLDGTINARVDKRVRQGIVREIEALLGRGVAFSDPAMTGLGYREWEPFFTHRGNAPDVQRDVIRAWKLHERQYARRQMTWFRRQPNIRWFDIRTSDIGKKLEQLVSAWYTGGAHGVKN
jgi:tRNA dimethylallyltransferase